jgi:predicted transcriptional regulator
MMKSETAPELERSEILQMTADIVSSFVSNNAVATGNLPELIRSVHSTIVELASNVTVIEPEKPKPAVPVNKSVNDEYIVCLEDGRKLKMLKRYLRSKYGMSPDEYRARWNLPSSYPMVAPNYAKTRSEYAKKIGLGRGGRKA